MSVAFATTRRVEFADTDMAGLVHFTTYYRMMESVEHEFLRSLGTSVLNRDDDGRTVSWPRLAAECEFHAPAFFEDELEISVRVASLGRSSLVLKYEFCRGDDRIANGRMKTVCCEVREGESLKAIEIPVALKSQLATLLEVE
jgi:YbgC/YbaW family acyl-CoA thioester hydrolase